MHTEIEERILEIDVDKVIKKLESLGATKKGEWFQKRYTYEFTPKRRDLFTVNKVLLLDPVFIKKIASKSLDKKLKTLFDQINIVLNDESDDEAGSYVLGEIERMQSLIISFYGKYLDDEYLALLLFKLDAFKSEIAMKEMKKVDLVDMKKSGRRR